MYAPWISEVTLTVIVQVEFAAIVPLFKVTDVPPLTAVREAEAPQPVSVGETGLARNTLVGRLSVSDTCVRLLPVSLFLITMERRLVSPAHTVAGLKLLLTDGGKVPVTFKVALAGVVFVILEPAPVEDNALAGMVLMRFPKVIEVTLMDTVHDPGVFPVCAGTIPPLKDIVVEPAVAVTEPPQELVKPAGLAITRPG